MFTPKIFRFVVMTIFASACIACGQVKRPPSASDSEHWKDFVGTWTIRKGCVVAPEKDDDKIHPLHVPTKSTPDKKKFKGHWLYTLGYDDDSGEAGVSFEIESTNDGTKLRMVPSDRMKGKNGMKYDGWEIANLEHICTANDCKSSRRNKAVDCSSTSRPQKSDFLSGEATFDEESHAVELFLADGEIVVTYEHKKRPGAVHNGVLH